MRRSRPGATSRQLLEMDTAFASPGPRSRHIAQHGIVEPVEDLQQRGMQAQRAPAARDEATA